MSLPLSPRLRARRSRRWTLPLALSLVASGALGCRPAPAPSPRPTPPASSSDAGQLQQRQRLAARQCRQRRDALLAGLAELRRAEAALADERAVAPPPAAAAPVWDEAKERRYSQVDQELDRQRYEQELAVWRQRQADRQAVIAAQRQRLEAAQVRLDRQAQLLQRQFPALFTAPASIEVRPQELERLSRCPETAA